MQEKQNRGMIKAVVFDIGGTLMEYRGMPNGWASFYPAAFGYARQKLKLEISDEQMKKSVELLKEYNPKLHYREIDYTPEEIFKKVTADWGPVAPLDSIIKAFFESMHLEAYIYDETVPTLERLRKQGIKIATYTDVAAGMPDEMHIGYFKELMPYFDKYVSSITCGYRKPNPKGLEEIARYFGITPEEMIMVGDEEKDIKVAKRFNCYSILIDRKETNADFGQDRTIRKLSEIEI